MDSDNYRFLREITKEEGTDLSKAVRDMVGGGEFCLQLKDIGAGRLLLGEPQNWPVFR